MQQTQATHAAGAADLVDCQRDVVHCTEPQSKQSQQGCVGFARVRLYVARGSDQNDAPVIVPKFRDSLVPRRSVCPNGCESWPREGVRG